MFSYSREIGNFCILWRNTANSYIIPQKVSLWNFLVNTLLLYIPLLTLTDRITDRETHTLALCGLEKLFFQLCWCVSFWFWREIGFGFTYLRMLLNNIFWNQYFPNSCWSIKVFCASVQVILNNFSCWIQIFFSIIGIGIRRGWWQTENSTWIPCFSFPREKQRVFIFQRDRIFLPSVKEYNYFLYYTPESKTVNFLVNTLLLYIPLLTLTDRITDRETLTLALRGLEDFFSSCAVVSVFGSCGK